MEFHFHIFQAVIVNLPFNIFIDTILPRHITATSVISLCVLRTAANSVLMLVHLHSYVLAVDTIAHYTLQSFYFFFHVVCKPHNVSNILVTPLIKGQAQNIWRGTQTTRQHCRSLFYFEHSLTYFLKCFRYLFNNIGIPS